MSEIWQNIGTGFATSSWLDLVNLVLNVAGVVLMIRRSLWTFPVSLVAVTVQGVLFFRTGFPADGTLQIFYFGALAWGWWKWIAGRADAPEQPVTTLSNAARALILAAATGATLAWVKLVAPHTASVMPWRDAFVAAFSVAAQILQVRRNLENWPLWIVVNVVAVSAYWSAALAFTAVLYLIFLGLAFAGWWQWRRSFRPQPA